eukprot:3770675-Rhodomonas_salina.1
MERGLSVHLPGQNTWTGQEMIWILSGDTKSEGAEFWISLWMAEVAKPVTFEWEMEAWECAEMALRNFLPDPPQREQEQ